MDHYWLTVQAEDRGLRPLSAVTEVYIEVADVNDNLPRVSSPVFYPSVREDVPPHSPVLQLEAQDADAGRAGRLRFNLTGGNALGLFTLDPDTGGKGWLGEESGDTGVPESGSQESYLGSLAAGAQSLSQAQEALRPGLYTGLLSTAQQLDREAKDEHILEVRASLQEGVRFCSDMGQPMTHGVTSGHRSSRDTWVHLRTLVSLGYESPQDIGCISGHMGSPQDTGQIRTCITS